MCSVDATDGDSALSWEHTDWLEGADSVSKMEGDGPVCGVAYADPGGTSVADERTSHRDTVDGGVGRGDAVLTGIGVSVAQCSSRPEQNIDEYCTNCEHLPLDTCDANSNISTVSCTYTAHFLAPV